MHHYVSLIRGFLSFHVYTNMNSMALGILLFIYLFFIIVLWSLLLFFFFFLNVERRVGTQNTRDAGWAWSGVYTRPSNTIKLGTTRKARGVRGGWQGVEE